MRGSRNVCKGAGGGVQVRRPENSLDNVLLLLLLFLVLNLFNSLQGIQWFYYRENYTFPMIQRGPTFSRGSNFLQGGPNANFYKNPYNLLFSRGVQTPIPSLDPHMDFTFSLW